MTLEATNVSASCRTSIFAKNSSICYDLPYHYVTCSFGMNMALGLPANCYVLWLSINEMIRRQSTEIFVFNTALVEVIFSFSFILLTRHYFFHCVVCKVPILTLGLLLFVGRPLHLCETLSRGFTSARVPQTHEVQDCLLCRRMDRDHVLVRIGYDERLYTFLLQEFLLFLIIKLYTCSMVLKALLRPGPGQDLKQRDTVNRDKIKAFRIMKIVLLSSMLTYIPLIISLVLYHVIAFEKLVLSWSISLCIGIMLGFDQPFLYHRRLGKLNFCFGALRKLTKQVKIMQ